MVVKIKPYSGLGKLDILYKMLKKLECEVQDYCLVVFAGDNGISSENTSIYHNMKSTEIVNSHISGRAPTVNLLKRLGKKEIIVNIGLNSPVENGEILNYNVKQGSNSFLLGDALEKGEVIDAIDAGRIVWDNISLSSFDIVGVGEIGVGEIGVANTLCAAGLVVAVTGLSPEYLVGRGSSDCKVIRKKVDIIIKALEKRRPEPDNAIDVLARFGGLEIAALAGFMSRAAEKRIPVMLDGFVTSAAALLASMIDERVINYLIVPSLSDQIGHQVILDKLGLQAIFDLDINYGEGLTSAIGLFLAEMASSFNRLT